MSADMSEDNRRMVNTPNHDHTAEGHQQAAVTAASAAAAAAEVAAPEAAATPAVPPAPPAPPAEPAAPAVTASPVNSGEHQPTTPLFEPAARGGVGNSGFTPPPMSPEAGRYAAFQADTAASAGTASPRDPQKSRATGMLVAGLAIGALLGGAVGGGVAALVAANQPQPAVSTTVGPGTVTLNNPETATDITQVAMVGTPSVVTVSVSADGAAGSGSGVIYDDAGHIITNAHVVLLDGSTTNPTIQVKLSDGRLVDATLVGTAPYTDIAVLKIDADNLTPIAVADSSAVNVGDLAVAIGAPMSLSNTVTSGVVSALNRGISVGSPLVPSDPEVEQPEDGGNGFPWDFRFDAPGQEDLSQQTSSGSVTLPVIQTDASINPGNSGGALLDGAGRLIGINVAIASPGSTEGTASSAGLGFAIPANLAARVADEIVAGDKPSYGLLGASVVDAEFATDLDSDIAGGVIAELVRGGAAEDAGLRVGDVITAIDGIPATDSVTVSALVRTYGAGAEVTVDYVRDGVAGEVMTTLGSLDW